MTAERRPEGPARLFHLHQADGSGRGGNGGGAGRERLRRDQERDRVHGSTLVQALLNVSERFPALRIPTILVAQRRRKVGEIRVPKEAQEGEYDLVLIGSPTWWLTTNMPVRSYLKIPAARGILDGRPFAAFSVSRRYWKGNMRDVRKLGEEAGGSWLGETHFASDGGRSTRCFHGFPI